MKKTVKVIAFALAAILMVFGVCACSGYKDDGKLTVATCADFPPYEYYEGGTIVGIDADIAALLGEKLGQEVVFEDMDFNSVVAAVQSGKCDIGMSGLTVNEERLVSVDFTDAYIFDAKQVIIVHDDSNITGPADLAGKQIAVQASTTGDIYATDEFGEESIQRFNKGSEAVLALTQGKVDAFIIDDAPAKVFASQNEGLMILDEEYTLEDYAIAIKKGNKELQEQLNAALAELTAEGKIDEVLAKYVVAE